MHAGYAFVSVQTEHLPPGLVCHVCHSRRLFIQPPFHRFITSLTSSPSLTSFIASTEVLNITPGTSHQSAGPAFRPSRAVRVPGSPFGASQSSASQSGASHTSVGPGHAQGSGVSVASTVTSVPTILTAAADVDYVVPSRMADEQIVNESLMNLLKTLTMRIWPVDGALTGDRLMRCLSVITD
jgi:hypothetical protein